ncbi:MAG: EamA family transporter [Chloroflexi bacterium]|nr:EamA family transporter [Chloroflexota bacterium]
MIRGAVYGLTAAAIWGGLYVVSDVVLPVIPPFALLTIRLFLGLAVLIAIIGVRRRRTGEPRMPSAGELPALIGGACSGLGSASARSSSAPTFRRPSTARW